MAPTFLQSLVVRVPLLASSSCQLKQDTRSRSGRRFGRYLRRPALLPNRHRQNPVAIRPGLRKSWRFQRYLQRSGKRCRRQRSWWCVLSLFSRLHRGRFMRFPALLAAIFFVTYDTLKQTLPTPPHLAPVNHMLSASMGEVVRFLRSTDNRSLPIHQAACLIRVPTEVIKTRTQTSTYGPSVTSSWASAKQVLKADGFAGFYRGFSTTIIREVRTRW
jgi:hypothetical protein